MILEQRTFKILCRFKQRYLNELCPQNGQTQKQDFNVCLSVMWTLDIIWLILPNFSGSLKFGSMRK